VSSDVSRSPASAWSAPARRQSSVIKETASGGKPASGVVSYTNACQKCQKCLSKKFAYNVRQINALGRFSLKGCESQECLSAISARNYRDISSLWCCGLSVVSGRYPAGLVKVSPESGNVGVVGFLARALGDRERAAHRDAPAIGNFISVCQ
jgi:hypothetical protein